MALFRRATRAILAPTTAATPNYIMARHFAVSTALIKELRAKVELP